MARATWSAVVCGLGTALLGSGCGQTQTTQFASDTQTTQATARDGTPAKRLARVRQLAVAGPDAEGAPEALVEALQPDEDLSVRKVAAVGLLSFGDKAIEPLRKKRNQPPLPDVPSKAPNPKKAPEDLLDWTDLIVYHDPYFADGLFPACLELTHDADPAIRVVSVRAIATKMGRYSSQLETIRAAAKNPGDDLHTGAKEFLQQREVLLSAVRKLTEDADDKVRVAAKDALKHLGE